MSSTSVLVVWLSFKVTFNSFQLALKRMFNVKSLTLKRNIFHNLIVKTLSKDLVPDPRHVVD